MAQCKHPTCLWFGGCPWCLSPCQALPSLPGTPSHSSPPPSPHHWQAVFILNAQLAFLGSILWWGGGGATWVAGPIWVHEGPNASFSKAQITLHYGCHSLSCPSLTGELQVGISLHPCALGMQLCAWCTTGAKDVFVEWMNQGMNTSFMSLTLSRDGRHVELLITPRILLPN